MTPDSQKKKAISNLIAGLFKQMKQFKVLYFKDFLATQKRAFPNDPSKITSICNNQEINQLLLSKIKILEKKFKIGYKVIYKEEGSLKTENVESVELKEMSGNPDVEILFFEIYSFELQNQRSSIIAVNGKSNGNNSPGINTNKKSIKFEDVERLVNQEFEYLKQVVAEERNAIDLNNEQKKAAPQMRGKRGLDFFKQNVDSKKSKAQASKRKKVNRAVSRKKKSGLFGFFSKK